MPDDGWDASTLRTMEFALRALARIEQHERDCAAGWRANQTALAELRESIDRLHRRWWQAVTTLIAAEFGVIGYLLSLYVLPAP